MDKPNKTDNAEQPAETADTEGGLTAEKPRSRRKKTSIAHIATVCGSVYTGGKTAKGIKSRLSKARSRPMTVKLLRYRNLSNCMKRIVSVNPRTVKTPRLTIRFRQSA